MLASLMLSPALHGYSQHAQARARTASHGLSFQLHRPPSFKAGLAREPGVRYAGICVHSHACWASLRVIKVKSFCLAQHGAICMITVSLGPCTYFAGCVTSEQCALVLLLQPGQSLAQCRPCGQAPAAIQVPAGLVVDPPLALATAGGRLLPCTRRRPCTGGDVPCTLFWHTQPSSVDDLGADDWLGGMCSLRGSVPDRRP